ncbi:MAG: hypothetical protein WA510_09675 [Acidobacteriaceae bacterium]
MESIDRNPGEPIKCAPLSRPTEAQKKIREQVQCLVVVAAIVAVFLLVASAFHYSDGHPAVVKHVRLLTPHVPLVHPG